MELSVFSWIVIFGFLALIVNSIGIIVVYKNKELAERADTYFMCFAAGLLITVPLVLVFPEAVEKIHLPALQPWLDSYSCFLAIGLSSIKPDKKPWHLVSRQWKGLPYIPL